MALRSNFNTDFSELKTLHCSNHSKDAKDGSAYLFCNEQHQAEALTFFAKYFEQAFGTGVNLSVHLGFSFIFNLDLLSLPGSPEVGIIFDIDPNMNAIYQCVEKVFQDPSIDTPNKFIEIFPKVLSDANLLWYPADWAQERFKELLSRKNSFLSSQENFLRLKKKFNDNQIFLGCADIINAITMNLIYNWCIKNKLPMQSMYLSNIAEWCLVKGIIKEMAQNIAPFIQPNTFVVDAFYPTADKKGSGPPQRICVGALPAWTLQTKTGHFLNKSSPAAHTSDVFEFEKEKPFFR